MGPPPLLPPRLPVRGFSEMSDESGQQRRTVHVTFRYRDEKKWTTVTEEVTVRLERSMALEEVRKKTGGRLVLGSRELTEGSVGSSVYNFAMVDVYPLDCSTMITFSEETVDAPPWREICSLSAYISRPLPDSINLLPTVFKSDTNELVRTYAKVEDLAHVKDSATTLELRGSNAEPWDLDVRFEDRSSPIKVTGVHTLTTVYDVKIGLEGVVGGAPEKQTLSFSGETLDDDARKLLYYNVQKDSTLDLAFSKATSTSVHVVRVRCDPKATPGHDRVPLRRHPFGSVKIPKNAERGKCFDADLSQVTFDYQKVTKTSEASWLEEKATTEQLLLQLDNLTDETCQVTVTYEEETGGEEQKKPTEETTTTAASEEEPPTATATATATATEEKTTATTEEETATTEEEETTTTEEATEEETPTTTTEEEEATEAEETTTTEEATEEKTTPTTTPTEEETPTTTTPTEKTLTTTFTEDETPTTTSPPTEEASPESKATTPTTHKVCPREVQEIILKAQKAFLTIAIVRNDELVVVTEKAPVEACLQEERPYYVEDSHLPAADAGQDAKSRTTRGKKLGCVVS